MSNLFNWSDILFLLKFGLALDFSNLQVSVVSLLYRRRIGLQERTLDGAPFFYACLFDNSSASGTKHVLKTDSSCLKMSMSAVSCCCL